MAFIPRTVFVCLLLLGPVVAGLCAEDDSDDKTGLKVGTKAPAFTLKDQNGKERSLKEFHKKGTLALVFFRSAEWWPFCRKQLVQLQADLKDFEAASIQVVGVSYDSVEVLSRFTEKQKITFPLLSDSGSKTITAYGLLNMEAKGKTEGIPHPGTMVIDRDGVIRAKLFLDGFRERHSKEQLIKAVEGIKWSPGAIRRPCP
jgi:peroxiredoxin